jgi:thiamine biosynthesis lipoprotein
MADFDCGLVGIADVDCGVTDGVTRRGLLGFERRRQERSRSSDHWIRVFRRAMACRFEVALSSDRAADVAAARRALAEADRLEEALSIFRPTSELSRLNQSGASRAVPVSDELFALLILCDELSVASDGAFDITSTPLSACWGFLKRAPEEPAENAWQSARALVGRERVALDAATRSVRFDRPGVSLNLGAIGKGYAVQAVASHLWHEGVRDALISAGGSSVVAMADSGESWRVDVRTTSAAGRLAQLRLRNVALGTSGAGEQYFELDGIRYAHVIDPRTGRPCSGIVSASVVTTDAARADALATAFFVGGVELAHRYCAAHPDTLALVTTDTGDRRTIVVGGCRGAIVEDVQ